MPRRSAAARMSDSWADVARKLIRRSLPGVDTVTAITLPCFIVHTSYDKTCLRSNENSRFTAQEVLDGEKSVEPYRERLRGSALHAACVLKIADRRLRRTVSDAVRLKVLDDYP